MTKRQLQLPSIPDEVVEQVIMIACLRIACLIGCKKLDPKKISSKKRFKDLINSIGRSHEDAFEVYFERMPQKLASAKACAEGADPESAVILIFTLIEGEINTLLRIRLRIRGYSNGAISDTLSGTDLKTKLNILFPLLGVLPTARIRQIAFESQKIRNSSVHFKANPAIFADSGDDREGDHSEIEMKAKDFLKRNQIRKIEKALKELWELCISGCPEIQQAYALFKRFHT